MNATQDNAVETVNATVNAAAPKKAARARSARKRKVPPLLPAGVEVGPGLASAVKATEAMMAEYEPRAAAHTAAEKATFDDPDNADLEAAFDKVDADWLGYLESYHKTTDALIDAPVSTLPEIMARTVAYLRAEALFRVRKWEVLDPQVAADKIEDHDDTATLGAVVRSLLQDLPGLITPPPADRELLALGETLEALWQEERDMPSGMGDEAYEAHHEKVSAVVDQIKDAKATTIEGLRVKARAVAWCHSIHDASRIEDIGLGGSDPTTDEEVAETIVHDLLRLSAPAPIDGDDAQLIALGVDYEAMRPRMDAAEELHNERMAISMSAAQTLIEFAEATETRRLTDSEKIRIFDEADRVAGVGVAPANAEDYHKLNDTFVERARGLRATTLAALRVKARILDSTLIRDEDADLNGLNALMRDLLALPAQTDVPPDVLAFERARGAYLAALKADGDANQTFEEACAAAKTEAPAPEILTIKDDDGFPSRHFLNEASICDFAGTYTELKLAMVKAFREWWPKHLAVFDRFGGYETLQQNMEDAAHRMSDALVDYLQTPAPNLRALAQQMRDAISFDVVPGYRDDIDDPKTIKGLLQADDPATNYLTMFYQHALRLLGHQGEVLDQRRTFTRHGDERRAA